MHLIDCFDITKWTYRRNKRKQYKPVLQITNMSLSTLFHYGNPNVLGGLISNMDYNSCLNSSEVLQLKIHSTTLLLSWCPLCCSDSETLITYSLIVLLPYLAGTSFLTHSEFNRFSTTTLRATLLTYSPCLAFLLDLIFCGSILECLFSWKWLNSCYPQTSMGAESEDFLK